MYKEWREEHGLTQAQAGRAIGVSKSTWGRIERGRLVAGVYVMAADALIKPAPQTEPQAADSDAQKHVVTLDQLYPEFTERFAPPEPMTFDRANVRTELVNNVAWFHLGDVCRVIDYLNYQNALRLVEPDDQLKLLVTDSTGRQVEAWHVSEAGLYQFLLSSNVPKAKPFKRWVTAEVLPAIHRQGSYALPVAGNIPDWAQTLLQGMGHSVIAVQQQQAATQVQIEQMQQTISQAPTQAADEVLARIQALETHKARLHDLVHSIVAKAKTLDQHDPDAQYYAQYANTWRSVHRYAQPPVSKLAGYTHPDQIEHAILGGESLLARLGGPVSRQMAMDLREVAV